jgi:hypothetical protein
MKGSEKQARYRVRHKGIAPERCDIDAVEQKYGPLPKTATLEEQAERYRLCQAQTLIRKYENGELPVDLMHALDEMRSRAR